MRNWIGIAVIVLAVLWLRADTHVPIRGTNTIPRQKNHPVEMPLTGNALLMEISRPMPPPLPTNTLARLRWIADGVYAVECDPGDIFIFHNEPKLTKGKEGTWKISFP